MPNYRDRKCTECGKVLKHTATKAERCLKCQRLEKKVTDTKIEIEDLAKWGYEFVSGPVYDKFNHRKYVVITPCCKSEYEFVFNNLRSQIKNTVSKGLPKPCGICGPQHRMKAALKGYIEEHGIDYDLTKANEYRRKVRGLTEFNYKHNKSTINPNNLPRGRNFGYHIDHVVSIIECFKQGWTPEQAASVSNLQMLRWEENLSKGA